MADQYVSKVYIEANGVMYPCKSCEDKSESKAESVPTMNPTGRALGYRKGVPTYTISVEAPIKVAGMPFDPYSLYPYSGDPFTVVVVREDTTRVTYGDCKVTNVGDKGEVNGEASQSLEIEALRRDGE